MTKTRRGAAMGLICLLGLLLQGEAQAADGTCNPAGFPVAVDIGHTPEAPGATSARGLPEYLFNAALGRDVAAALSGAGFPALPILVTGDGKQQLARRVAVAKARKPALLISLHHDSVQPRYMGEWRFAGRELTYSDHFSGFSIFVSRANPRFAESLAFASGLGRELMAVGLSFSRHHAENIPGENRKALDAAHGVFEFRNLKILKDVDAPAILFEAGLIVNRAEELELASPERRQLASRAIVAAVTEACARKRERLVFTAP
jgi:N-acetylmuramoyl-L-alanine amidase